MPRKFKIQIKILTVRKEITSENYLLKTECKRMVTFEVIKEKDTVVPSGTTQT